MTTREHDDALAAAVEAAVLATPGVAAVYPTGPLITNVLDTATQALGLPASRPRVRVESTHDGLTVSASVGVHAAVSAKVTAAAITDAIVDALAQAGTDDPRVHLTVVHIDERSVARRVVAS